MAEEEAVGLRVSADVRVERGSDVRASASS